MMLSNCKKNLWLCGAQRFLFFSIRKNHECLSLLVPLNLRTYVMGQGFLEALMGGGGEH